jgi:hypothetical protein
MADAISQAEDPAVHTDSEDELRREAFTMALYVAICLLAALSAVTDHTAESERNVFKLVWGTTVGLALAHWFAFRVSARLVASGTARRHDALAAGVQLGGAAAVGLLATVPMLVLPESLQLDVVRDVLALFIAVVARSGGAGRGRSMLYGASILIVATIVAGVKNSLVGH